MAEYRRSKRWINPMIIRRQNFVRFRKLTKRLATQLGIDTVGPPPLLVELLRARGALIPLITEFDRKGRDDRELHLYQISHLSPRVTGVGVREYAATLLHRYAEYLQSSLVNADNERHTLSLHRLRQRLKESADESGIECHPPTEGELQVLRAWFMHSLAEQLVRHEPSMALVICTCTFEDDTFTVQQALERSEVSFRELGIKRRPYSVHTVRKALKGVFREVSRQKTRKLSLTPAGKELAFLIGLHLQFANWQIT
jgi:hypothetical protein